MRPQANAEKDRTPDLTPPIKPDAPWRVTNVEPLPGFRLRVTFNDSKQGVVDLNKLIHGENAGVFTALREPAAFAKARVEMGAVTWPGGQDLAPDAMHRTISEKGEWTPV